MFTGPCRGQSIPQSIDPMNDTDAFAPTRDCDLHQDSSVRKIDIVKVCHFGYRESALPFA